jgi:copper chaperone CopZ
MMKKILFGLIILSMFSCSEGEKQGFDPKNLVKDSIGIAGMVCDGCAQTICGRLKEEQGVSECSVKFDDSTAIVTYDKTQTNPEKLKNAIKDAGYDTRNLKQ